MTDKLSVKLYKSLEHADMLKYWLIYRDMDPTLVNDLPHLGYIVEGIAAGFLRQCEGPYGLIDGYITNPTKTSEERNEALDIITESLINDAKAKGINHLLAFTRDNGILERAKKHGFAHLPHHFMVFEHKGQ